MLPSEENRIESKNPYYSNPKTRNQADRSRMSYQERMIALDLLEDLSIPFDKWSTNEELTGDQEQNKNSNDRLDFFSSSDYQSILSEHNSRKKTLKRYLPVELSEDDIRSEDLLKEIVDGQIKIIDSISTDHELINWISIRVFHHTTVNTNSSTIPLVVEPEKSDFGNVPPSLGQEHIDPQLCFEELDPSEILKRPLCMTPLSSPILIHLLKVFPKRFQAPHTALHLYNQIKTHNDPLVRYLGLTRPVFLESIKIRWSYFKDLNGILNDMIEMRNMGIDMNEQFKRFIQLITEEVIREGIEADKSKAKDLVDVHNSYRHFSASDQRIVGLLENMIAEYIESEKWMSARTLRMSST